MSRSRGIARKCPAFFSVPAFLTFSPRAAFFSMFEFFAAKREKFPAPWLALGPLHLLFFRSLARRFSKSPRAKHGFFLIACPPFACLVFYFPARLPSAFLKNFRRSLLIFLTRLDRFPLDSAKLFWTSPSRSKWGRQPGVPSVHRPQPRRGLAHRLPGLAPPVRPPPDDRPMFASRRSARRLMFVLGLFEVRRCAMLLAFEIRRAIIKRRFKNV